VPGETDLAALLADLDVAVRPGRFTFVTLLPGESAPPGAQAMVVEDEGITWVVPAEGDDGFVAAWLTLTVHSALEAVGLTAAVSAALAAAGISCNVLAGHHHDHLLVPADRADDAVAVLRRLAAR
jgi:uncharacterized protein